MARAARRLGEGDSRLGPFDILPEDLKARIYDQLIHRIANVADSTLGKQSGNAVRKLAVSPRFAHELSAAITVASDRVARTSPNPEIMQEIIGARKIWESTGMLDALERIIRNPGIDRMAENEFLRQTFATALPDFQSDPRYADALTSLLQAVVEELWNHKELAPIYQNYLARAANDQRGLLIDEMRGMRQTNEQMLQLMTSHAAHNELASGEHSARALPRKAPADLDLRQSCRMLSQIASSRDVFVVPLPKIKIPCNIYSTGRPSRRHEDASRHGSEFLLQPDSNLLVVLGEFGSGKSTLLRGIADSHLEDPDLYPIVLDFADLASSLKSMDSVAAISHLLASFGRTAASEFDALVDEHPEQILVLIDSFDEVNLSLDVADLRPDLNSISTLMKAGIRTAIASRSNMAIDSNEFVKQLQSSVRARALGASRYEIIELGACSLEEVNRTLIGLPPEQASTMSEYLSSGRHMQMTRVRRPLFLQMLIDLPNQRFIRSEGFSVYQLYHLYVEMSLERDMDRPSSMIPSEVKRRILEATSWEMFTKQKGRIEARLSTDDVFKILVTEISRERNLTWSAAPTQRGHSWLAEFMATNHLLVELAGIRSTSASAVEFVHQSLYEYFLACYLTSRFHETGRFGLEDDTHSVRAFDSLLPYFLRAQFRAGQFGGEEPADESDLIALVSDPSSSNMDRLLAFFFLEDDPAIQDLLRATSNSYRDFLLTSEWNFESFFMQKLVRFQLVLLDYGIGRALQHVSEARKKEADSDQDIEVHTFAARKGPTDFLLARLRNPHLVNALPITVYRLGMFADARALGPLREQLAKSDDPLFTALVNEAIERITARTES